MKVIYLKGDVCHVQKKIGVLLLTGLFIASPLFQSPAQASETSTKQTKYYTEELEHLYPDSDYANNDTMDKAQFLQHSLHLNKTYLYHEGSISSMNDIDFTGLPALNLMEQMAAFLSNSSM